MFLSGALRWCSSLNSSPPAGHESIWNLIDLEYNFHCLAKSHLWASCSTMWEVRHQNLPCLCFSSCFCKGNIVFVVVVVQTEIKSQFGAEGQRNISWCKRCQNCKITLNILRDVFVSDFATCLYKRHTSENDSGLMPRKCYVLIKSSRLELHRRRLKIKFREHSS